MNLKKKCFLLVEEKKMGFVIVSEFHATLHKIDIHLTIFCTYMYFIFLLHTKYRNNSRNILIQISSNQTTRFDFKYKQSKTKRPWRLATKHFFLNRRYTRIGCNEIDANER